MNISPVVFAFNALMLWVGWQEGHLTGKSYCHNSVWLPHHDSIVASCSLSCGHYYCHKREAPLKSYGKAAHTTITVFWPILAACWQHSTLVMKTHPSALRCHWLGNRKGISTCRCSAATIRSSLLCPTVLTWSNLTRRDSGKMGWVYVCDVSCYLMYIFKFVCALLFLFIWPFFLELLQVGLDPQKWTFFIILYHYLLMIIGTEFYGPRALPVIHQQHWRIQTPQLGGNPPLPSLHLFSPLPSLPILLFPFPPVGSRPP